MGPLRKHDLAVIPNVFRDLFCKDEMLNELQHDNETLCGPSFFACGSLDGLRGIEVPRNGQIENFDRGRKWYLGSPTE
jgi:hypothetical protein